MQGKPPALALLAFFLFTAELAYSQKAPERIAVYAPSDSLARFTGTKLVLTRKEIERQNAPSLIEYLAQIPGVSFLRVGGVGGNTSVFIRGGASDQTLILIDGIPISDQSQIAGTFSLDHVPIAQVERIEVVRGPLGVAYGSDGIAGAINIITREAIKGVKGQLEVSSSEAKRFELAFGVPLSAKVNLVFAGQHLQDKSLSDADAANDNPEKDPYKRQATYARVSYTSGNWQAQLTAEEHLGEKKLDKYSFADGLPKDDLNYESQSHLQTVRALGLFEKGPYFVALKASHHKVARHFEDQPDARFSFDSSSKFAGEGDFSQLSFGYDWQKARLLAGVQARSETARVSSTEHKRSMVGFYGVLDWQLSSYFGLKLGGRQDEIEDFSAQNTYTGEAYFAKGRHTSYLRAGSSYKAPTLYRLYSQYGNEDLEAERGGAIEAGYGLAWGAVQMNVDVFSRRIQDEVTFDMTTSRYDNRQGRGRYDGGELFLGYGFLEHHRLGIWYSRVHFTHDEVKKLARRPLLTGGFRYSGQWAGQDFFLLGHYVAKRPDSSGKDLRSFWDVSAQWGQRFSGYLSGYVRVENLLNEKIVYANGYSHKGRLLYGGVKWGF